MLIKENQSLVMTKHFLYHIKHSNDFIAENQVIKESGGNMGT